MKDFVEHQGRYRRQVWETNKAHALGFCRWCVQYLTQDLGWVTVSSGNYPVTVDKALADSESFLQAAIENNFGEIYEK